MKVLQVNNVYDCGSTGKLTKYIHDGLTERGIESVVLYGRRQRTKEHNIYKTCTELEAKAWNVLSRITGHPYSVAPVGTAELLRRLKQEKPDIVHLQCLNDYFVDIYVLLEWLKKHKIPTVLTLHADFMFTGGCTSAVDCDQWSIQDGCGDSECSYFRSRMLVPGRNPSGCLWRKMKRALDGFDDRLVVVSVSEWLRDRAQRSPILQGKKHAVIYNGLDTGVFSNQDGLDLRRKHHCEDKRVVLHVTPFFSAMKDHLKGGYYVLELARRMPDTVFLVAGRTEDKISAPPNVVFLGMITEQHLLAQYYCMADVTLLTSKSETFSMVCAESLCCGTPVIGFKAGAPEQIAIPEFSHFVEYGDVDGIYKLLCTQEKSASRETIALKSHSIYSRDNMLEGYLQIYCGLEKKPGCE